MRLFRQIIRKKYQNYLESVANRKNNYWDFFQTLGLVCVIDNVEIDRKELMEVTRAWKNWISKVNAEKSLGIMEKFAKKYTHLITKFLKETQSLEEQEVRLTGMYEKGRGIIGVLSYEYYKG